MLIIAHKSSSRINISADCLIRRVERAQSNVGVEPMRAYGKNCLESAKTCNKKGKTLGSLYSGGAIKAGRSYGGMIA